MGCSASQPAESQQPPANTTRRQPQQQTAGRRSQGRNDGRLNEASFSASVVGWDKEFPAMTLAQLEAKRSEFWDTRVQGRAECWQAIRVAVEASESEGDMSTTQAILESAEMTPFEVERVDTCFSYDSKGFKYEIPLYCVFKPSNLLPTAVSSSVGNNKPASNSPAQPLVVAPAPVKTAPALVENDQKAQEIVTTGKPLSFKVRFSNGLPDLAVDQKTSCTIGQLKQLIQQKHPALGPERVRMYYLGKHMSQDRWNLGEIGMKSSMILQAFVPGVFSK